MYRSYSRAWVHAHSLCVEMRTKIPKAIAIALYGVITMQVDSYIHSYSMLSAFMHNVIVQAAYQLQ